MFEGDTRYERALLLRMLICGLDDDSLIKVLSIGLHMWLNNLAAIISRKDHWNYVLLLLLILRELLLIVVVLNTLIVCALLSGVIQMRMVLMLSNHLNAFFQRSREEAFLL